MLQCKHLSCCLPSSRSAVLSRSDYYAGSATPPGRWLVWEPSHPRRGFPSWQARLSSPALGGAFPLSLVPLCPLGAIAGGLLNQDSDPCLDEAKAVRRTLRFPLSCAHPRRGSRPRAWRVIRLITASNLPSDGTCIPTTLLFLLLWRLRCGARFPDGTEALTWVSPWRAIAKGSVLGPAAEPVSPFLGQISHRCGPYRTRFAP